MTYQRGDRIRFTVGPLGLLESISSTRFVDATVKKGDEGIYQGPHPLITEEDWHIVQVGEWICPVHGGMIDQMTEKIE
jgi:hypothetical protein